ncbi:uncharacterized protein LOC108938193 [Scleropages formosus]|uniref:uncharacterized protein LOC108938193 n=1 Tax=Scleropages formosus TaxID=113540 RepID=UPI000878E6E9|nr:uncharacterized protein LOC108938193 [Scleropages formosus]
MDYLYHIPGLLLLVILAEVQESHNSTIIPSTKPIKSTTCTNSPFSIDRTMFFSATIGFLIIIIIVLVAILLRRKLAEHTGITSNSLKEGNNIQMMYMKSVESPSEEDAACSLPAEGSRTEHDDDSSDDSSSTSSESSGASVDLPFKDDYVNLSQGGIGACPTSLLGVQDYVNVVPRHSSDSMDKDDDDAPKDTATSVESDSEDSEDNELNYTTVVFN